MFIIWLLTFDSTFDEGRNIADSGLTVDIQVFIGWMSGCFIFFLMDNNYFLFFYFLIFFLSVLRCGQSSYVLEGLELPI